MFWPRKCELHVRIRLEVVVWFFLKNFRNDFSYILYTGISVIGSHAYGFPLTYDESSCWCSNVGVEYTCKYTHGKNHQHPTSHWQLSHVRTQADSLWNRFCFQQDWNPGRYDMKNLRTRGVVMQPIICRCALLIEKGQVGSSFIVGITTENFILLSVGIG